MLSRRLRAGVPAVLVAAVLGACSSTIPGVPVPASTGATSSAPTASNVPGAFRGCTITSNGSNVSSRSNVGISTSTSNNGTRINCGGAGQMSLTSVDSSEIVVAIGGDSVTVSSGETKQVGPYEVAVLSITDGTAVFTMALQS